MAPKSSSRIMPRSEAKQRKTQADMLAEVKRVVDRNTPAVTLRGGSLTIRDTKGKRKTLIGADSKPTLFGQLYHDQLGVEVPKNYAYDQPLQADTFVYDRQGKKVVVRRRSADGAHWVITKAGEAYFKFNRTEFEPRIPYLIAKPLDSNGNRAERVYTVPNRMLSGRGHEVPVEIIRPPHPGQYMPLPNFSKSKGGMTVGQVRQLRVENRPVHASRENQEEEVLEAALAFIAKQPYLVDLDDRQYRIIWEGSGIWMVYDEDREIRMDSSTVNSWRAGPTDTQILLDRTLRDFSIPSGMWRPFDLDADSFEVYSHGCAVQMLHKSMVKPRLSGAGYKRQRNGAIKQAPLPILGYSIVEVSDELDICFQELKYVIGEWPYPYGWRVDGVTSNMVLHFCKRQTERGEPIKCAIFHGGLKIHEYIPETANDHSPAVVFSIHSEHAYFYNKGFAKKAAALCKSKGDKVVIDEYTNRKIRDPFPRNTCPPFDKWLDGCNFEDGWGDSMVDGFAEVTKRYIESEKQIRVGDTKDAAKDALYYYTKESLEHMSASAVKRQDALTGTDQCFGILHNYGSSPEVLSSITFYGKGHPNITLRHIPAEAFDLDNIAKANGLTYRGESLGAFGEQLRINLTKQRIQLSDDLKQAVETRQDGKCAMCSETPDKAEFDHIKPLKLGGTNLVDNIQILCVACHKDKTGEQQGIHRNAWYSEPSTDLHEAMILYPKRQQLVFGDGKTGCRELDIIKCRRWALEKSPSPLPVLSVTDEVLVFHLDHLNTASYFFIDAGPGDTTDAREFTAYHGPDWYTRDLARWCVDTAVNGQKRKIDHNHDFVASVIAREHIQPEEVANIYSLMSEAVQTTLEEKGVRCGQAIDLFTKTMILSMQGGWLTRHSYSWKCIDSKCKGDVPPRWGDVFKERLLDNETGLTRYMIRNETFSSRTMYLFGLCALNTEHMLVSRAIDCARSMGCTVHGCVVDGVMVSGDETDLWDLRQQARAEVRVDGTAYFRIKQDDSCVDILHTAMKNPMLPKVVIPVASPHRPSEFTCGNLKSRFKSTAIGAHLYEPRFMYPRVWEELSEDSGVGSCDANDTFQEEAAKAIFKRGSACVIGAGGTGKSELVKHLVALYKKADIRVDIIAFTHVQAQNCGGCTLLHDMHTNPRCKRRVVIIDEAGQVGLNYWGVLNSYRVAGGCNLVVLGDFAGQLPPITDQGNFDLWKQFPSSDFMHDICSGFRVNLRKFRRRNFRPDGTPIPADYAHFTTTLSLYPSLTDDETALFGGALQKVRASYPATGREAATHLVVTNVQRLRLNAHYNEVHARRHVSTFVEYEGENPKCQSLHIWEGIVLQAVLTERTSAYSLGNALRYRVLTVDGDSTRVALVDDKGRTGSEMDPANLEGKWAPFQLLTSLIPHKLVATHAITYDSSQARTLHGGVFLTQVSHPRMTLRKLIVGLGRAPAGSDVQVEGFHA